MWKIFETVFRWIFPPKIDATPEQVQAWRQSMSMIVGALVGFSVFGFMWSEGLTPLSEGYARNSAVAQLASALHDHRASILATTILDTQRNKCATADGALRTVLVRQLTDQLQQYRELKGQDFPLPSCEDI